MDHEVPTEQSAGSCLCRRNQRDHLLARASLLAGLTIGYNLVEGIVSIALGGADETLALFGFGVDSFIEVISAIGVWHMLRRIRTTGGRAATLSSSGPCGSPAGPSMP